METEGDKMTCPCGKALTFNEMGLDKKFNGGIPLCETCLAKKLGVTGQKLREKAEEFRRAGCLFFTKEG